MTTLLEQQRALLQHKFEVLARLQEGLEWSFQRLPELADNNIHDPAVSERIAAIVERFTKLQDQLAGTLQHAYTMLGERHRSFADVVNWAVKQEILPDSDTWLELRTLRNRLTHEYDLESDQLPELIALVRDALTTLAAYIERFRSTCQSLGLLA